jgi:DNA binding domain, excisionase family
MEEHPEALRVEEVARLLQVSTRTVYVLLKYGKLRGVRVGRAWRVPRDEVDRFLHPGKPEE